MTETQSDAFSGDSCSYNNEFINNYFATPKILNSAKINSVIAVTVQNTITMRFYLFVPISICVV